MTTSAEPACATRLRAAVDAATPRLLALSDDAIRHRAAPGRWSPAEVRTRLHQRHSLHRVAFRPVPENRSTTLDYLMNDYVDHLEHHLAQLLVPNDA